MSEDLAGSFAPIPQSNQPLPSARSVLGPTLLNAVSAANTLSSTNPMLTGLHRTTSGQLLTSRVVPLLPSTLGTAATAHNPTRPISEVYNAFMKNTLADASRVYIGGNATTSRFRAAVARYRSSPQTQQLQQDQQHLSIVASEPNQGPTATVQFHNQAKEASPLPPAVEYAAPQPKAETHAQYYLHNMVTVEHEDSGVVAYPSVPFGANVFAANGEYEQYCGRLAADRATEMAAAEAEGEDPYQYEADPGQMAEATRLFLEDTAIREMKRQQDYIDVERTKLGNQFNLNYIANGSPSQTISFAGQPSGVRFAGGGGSAGDRSSVSLASIGEKGNNASLGGSVANNATAAHHHASTVFASVGGVHTNPKHTFIGPSDRRLASMSGANGKSSGGYFSQADVHSLGRFLASTNRLGSCNTATMRALSATPSMPSYGAHNTSVDNSIDSGGGGGDQKQGALLAPVPFKVFTACVIEKLNTAERADTTTGNNSSSVNSGRAGVGGDGSQVDDFTGFALLHNRALPPRFANANNGFSSQSMDGEASRVLGAGGSPNDVYCTMVLYRAKQVSNNTTAAPGRQGTYMEMPYHTRERSAASSYFEPNPIGDFGRGRTNSQSSNPNSNAANISPPLGPMAGQPIPPYSREAVNNNILLCAANRQHDEFAKRYRECCELDYECFIQETVLVPWATRNSTLEYTNVVAQQSWDQRGKPFASIGGGLLFVKTMQNTNTSDAHEKRLAAVSRVGFVDVYKFVREVCALDRALLKATLGSKVNLKHSYSGGLMLAAGHSTSKDGLESSLQQPGGSYTNTGATNTPLVSEPPSGDTGHAPDVTPPASQATLAPVATLLSDSTAKAFPRSVSSPPNSVLNDPTDLMIVPRLFPQEVLFWRQEEEGAGGAEHEGRQSRSGARIPVNNTTISVSIDETNPYEDSFSGGRHKGAPSIQGMSSDLLNTSASGGGGAASSNGGQDYGYNPSTRLGYDISSQTLGAKSVNSHGYGMPAGTGSYASNTIAGGGYFSIPVPVAALFNYTSICIATCYSHYSEDQLLTEGYAMGGASTHSKGQDISYRCAGVMLSVSSNNQVAVAKLTRRQQSLSAASSPAASSPRSPVSPNAQHGPRVTSPPMLGSYAGEKNAWEESSLASTYPRQEIFIRISIPTTLPWNQQRIVQELIDFRIPTVGAPGAAASPSSLSSPPNLGSTNPGTSSGNTSSRAFFAMPSLLSIPTSPSDRVGKGSPNPGPPTASANDEDSLSCRIANSAGQQYVVCFAQDPVESQWMGAMLHVQAAPPFLAHQQYTYLSYFAHRAHANQPWREDFRLALRNLPIRFFEGPNAQSACDLDAKTAKGIQLQPIVQCVATFGVPKQITKAYYCSRDRILLIGAADGSAAIVGEGSSTWQTLFSPVRRRMAAMTAAEAASALAINSVASVRIPTATLKKRSRFGAKASTTKDSTAAGVSARSQVSATSDKGAHSASLPVGDHSLDATHASEANPAADEDTMMAFHRILRTVYSIRGAFSEAVFVEIFSPLAMLMGGVPPHMVAAGKDSPALTHGPNGTIVNSLGPLGGLGMAGVTSKGDPSKDPKAAMSKSSSNNNSKQSSSLPAANSPPSSSAGDMPALAPIPSSSDILGKRKDIRPTVEIIDVEATLYHDVYMVTTNYAAALIHVAIRKSRQTTTTIIEEEEEEVLSDDSSPVHHPHTLESISMEVGRIGTPVSSNGKGHGGVTTLSHTSKALPEVRSISLAYVVRVLSRKVGHYAPNEALNRFGGAHANANVGSSSGILGFFKRSRRDTIQGGASTTSSAGGSTSASPVSLLGSRKTTPQQLGARAMVAAAAVDALANGSQAGGLIPTRFQLLHVHLPAALQGSGVIPPLAFLTSPLSYIPAYQNRQGGVAGKVSSGLAVLLHTMVDAARLDAAAIGCGILATFANGNNGYSNMGLSSRAAARARQILGGVGAASPRSDMYASNLSTTNNSMYFSPTQQLLLGATPRNMSNNASTPMKPMSLVSLPAADALFDATNSSSARQAPPVTASLTTPARSHPDTVAKPSSAASTTSTNAAAGGKPAGGSTTVGRFFSKIFGGKNSNNDTAASNSNSKGKQSSAATNTTASKSDKNSSTPFVSFKDPQGPPVSPLGNNVSATYATSEGNMSFSVGPDGAASPAPHNAKGAPAGGGADITKGDSKVGPAATYSTDVDIITTVYESSHCLPPKEEVVEVRGPAAGGEGGATTRSSHSDRTASRNLSTEDMASGSPPSHQYHRQHSAASNPNGGAYRRLRRIERVAHTIEAPIIISLTSPGATDPNEYPDVRSLAFAVNTAAYAGATPTLKYAISDSWGVPSYSHPASPQPRGQPALPPPPEFRTKPIVQPDLLDRFDVYKTDCTPENTVSSLCDGYGRNNTQSGTDLPVTVVALDARLHGVLCILHAKDTDHEVYCCRDEQVHDGLNLFTENSLSKGF